MWYQVCLILCIFMLTSQAAPAALDPYTEDMKNRNQIALECINQVQINVKVVKKVIYNPSELPNDDRYKEFLTCSYKKQKFQNEEGEMLYHNIYDFLGRFYDRDELRILDQCKSITAENDREMAYSSLVCILHGLRSMNDARRRMLYVRNTKRTL